MARAREEAGDCRMVSGREPSSHIIRVSVKTPQDCQEFILAENSSVRNFKKQISKRLHCNTDRLVLIFTGKILRDQDILSQRGILDGTTVHLVVRSHLKGALPPPGTLPGHADPGTHCAETSTSHSAATLASLGRLVRCFPHLADFLNQLVQQLVTAPESVVQYLEDPLVQSLASEKPVNVSQIPELTRPVQKMEAARKALETLQNPSRQQDLLQTNKWRLEALNTVPGGDSARPTICPDIQHLMLSSVAPLVATKGHSPGSEPCRGEASAHNRTDATSILSTASASSRPVAQDIRQEVSTGSVAHTWGMTSRQTSSGLRNGMSELDQDSSAQESQQPIGKNTVASQLRSSPHALCRVLHVLQQNPAHLHHLTAGSPLRHHMPLLPILTNPRALQALIQIERGLQILLKEVPGLESYLQGTGRPNRVRGVPESRGRGQDNRGDALSATLAFLQLLYVLASACSQSTQSPPSSTPLTEGSYQQELEHLKAMGFADHDENLQALMATGGNVHKAIERLMGTPEP